MSKTLLTAREVWSKKSIYWITSYKALLKYISEDYADILQPIVKESRNGAGKSGRRYFLKEENVKKFVEMFENNELN